MYSFAIRAGDRWTGETRLIVVAILCAAILSGSICVCIAQQMTAHPQQYVSPDTIDVARLRIIQPDHDWESVLPGVPVDIAVDASANIESVTYTIRDILFPDDPLRTTVLQSTRPSGFSSAYYYNFPVVWNYNGVGDFEITAAGTITSYPVQVSSTENGVQSLVVRGPQHLYGAGPRQVTAPTRPISRRSGRDYKPGTQLIPVHPYDTDGSPGPQGYVQLKGGIHIHWYQDGPLPDRRTMKPVEVAREYANAGYRFIAMTEHDHLTPPSEEATKTLLNSNFVWLQYCEEWTPKNKHILAIGVDGRKIGSGPNSRTEDLSTEYGRSTTPLLHDWEHNRSEFDFKDDASISVHGNEILGASGADIDPDPENNVFCQPILNTTVDTIGSMGGFAFIPHPGKHKNTLPGYSILTTQIERIVASGGPAKAVAVQTRAIARLARGLTTYKDLLNMNVVQNYLAKYPCTPRQRRRLIGAYTEEDYTPGVPFAEHGGHTWMSLDIKPSNWDRQDNAGRSSQVMGALQHDRWWSYTESGTDDFVNNVGTGAVPWGYPLLALNVNTASENIEIRSTYNNASWQVKLVYGSSDGVSSRIATLCSNPPPSEKYPIQYEVSYSGIPKLHWAYVTIVHPGILDIFSNPIRFVPNKPSGGGTQVYVCENTSPGLVVEYADEEPETLPEMGYIEAIYEVTGATPGVCPSGAALTLPFDRQDVSYLGINNLKIFYYDGTNWSPVANSTVDASDETVTAHISVLGKYTVSAVPVEDTTPPNVCWLAPDEGDTLTGAYDLKVAAEDNVGVSSVAFMLTDSTSGKLWQLGEDTTALDGGWGLSVDLSHYPSGSYVLEAEASDLAGNTASASRTISLQTTATLPQVTIGNPYYSSADSAIVVEGTVSEDCTVEVSLDGALVGPAVIDEEATPVTWKFTFDCGTYGPDEHTITARAIDRYNNENSATIDGTATALELSSACLEIYPDSPQLANTEIGLYGSAAGGSSEVNLQYDFSVSADGGNNWTTIAQAEGDPDNSRTWVPTASGSYLLKVAVQDGTVTKESTADYVIAGNLSGVSLSTNADESPVRATTSNVQLVATPTNGASVEYKFEAFIGAGTEPVAQRDYDSWSSWLWVPETQGIYRLKVTAREFGTPSPEFTAQVVDYEVLPALLSGLALATDLVSPQLSHTDITLTATPTGGTNPEVKFLVYKDSNPIPCASRDFGSATSWEWTPAEGGSYRLEAVVREYGTTEPTFDNEIPDYSVLQELISVAISVDPDTSPQSVQTPITMTAVPTGGVSLLYRFEVYLSTDLQNPVAVRDYGSSGSWTWTPTLAGTYRLRALVRETYPGREDTLVADRDDYVIQ